MVGPSPFRAVVPLLHMAPAEYTIDGKTYRAYLREDVVEIIRNLKAACIATGGSREECQAE